MRGFVLGAALLVAGGCGSPCKTADYTGTFDGDSVGSLAMSVDGDAVDFALSSDGGALKASGSGTMECSDGKFTVDIFNDYDAESTEVYGTVEGAVFKGEGAGFWELIYGDNGTWEFGGKDGKDKE